MDVSPIRILSYLIFRFMDSWSVYSWIHSGFDVQNCKENSEKLTSSFKQAEIRQDFYGTS